MVRCQRDDGRTELRCSPFAPSTGDIHCPPTAQMDNCHCLLCSAGREYINWLKKLLELLDALKNLTYQIYYSHIRVILLAADMTRPMLSVHGYSCLRAASYDARWHRWADVCPRFAIRDSLVGSVVKCSNGTPAEQSRSRRLSQSKCKLAGLSRNDGRNRQLCQLDNVFSAISPCRLCEKSSSSWKCQLIVSID